jgi:hypothetical protein
MEKFQIIIFPAITFAVLAAGVVLYELFMYVAKLC